MAQEVRTTFFSVWKKEFVLRKISAVRCGNCGKNIRDCGKNFSQLRGLEVSRSRSLEVMCCNSAARPRNPETALPRQPRSLAIVERDRRANHFEGFVAVEVLLDDYV